jgi:hypothetical protein
MAVEGSLKRLGGGRWATRDGRFAIEPQSGTWVVVDNSQIDELGLPLVRGPFGSLTAAREAIEGAREAGPAESPLAGRLREAEAARSKRSATAGKAGASTASESTRARRSGRAPAGDEAPEPDAVGPETPKPPPEPPREPKWLSDLAPAERRRARDLIEELERLEIAGAEALARAEIAMDQPALTRLAIERSLRAVIAAATEPGDAVRTTAEVLLSGRDRELDVRWRIVDLRGRPVTRIDLDD